MRSDVIIESGSVEVHADWRSDFIHFLFCLRLPGKNKMLESWRSFDGALALVPKETSGENCILSFLGYRLKQAVSLAYLLQ